MLTDTGFAVAGEDQGLVLAGDPAELLHRGSPAEGVGVHRATDGRRPVAFVGVEGVTGEQQGPGVVEFDEQGHRPGGVPGHVDQPHATVRGTPSPPWWPALAPGSTADAEDGETRGHTNFTARVVNVDPQHDAAERVHILVHELGHIRCDHEGRREVSRAQRETEAESVAFIVSTVLGLDLGDVAAVYGDPDTITAAQAAIHTAARSCLPTSITSTMAPQARSTSTSGSQRLCSRQDGGPEEHAVLQ